MPQPAKRESKFKRAFVNYLQFITPAVAIIFLVIGVLFVLKPKYDHIKLIGALNIEAKKEELAKDKKYLGQLRELQNNYARVDGADIVKLNRALPKEEDIPGLFVQLENLVRVAGFNLLSIDISSIENVRGKTKEMREIKKKNIAITIDGGNYSALKTLLREIELNLRLFDVDSLNFAAGSNLYTLNLSTYYYSSK